MLPTSPGPSTLASLALGVVLLGCGADDPPTRSTPSEPEPTREAAPEAEESEIAVQTARGRADAVQLAEAFVRDQAYTDLEPLIRAPLVPEPMERTPPRAEERRGTLYARAIDASQAGDGWMVFFRYLSGRAGLGRAVQVHADGRCEMVHQEAHVGAERTPIEVVGRIISLPGVTAHCGVLHTAVVVDYQVLRVERGDYPEPYAMVIVACPELARPSYDASSGDAGPLRLGLVHRLTLAPHVPPITGGLSIDDPNRNPTFHRYWAERIDMASAP
ncbi:MAG: hypothetical protein AB7S26_08130 [Sandaracinaceae bacterium]